MAQAEESKSRFLLKLKLPGQNLAQADLPSACKIVSSEISRDAEIGE